MGGTCFGPGLETLQIDKTRLEYILTNFKININGERVKYLNPQCIRRRIVRVTLCHFTNLLYILPWGGLDSNAALYAKVKVSVF